MGKRGPQREPAALKLLKGESPNAPSRVNLYEPKPPVGRPTPPEWLDERGVGLFEQVVDWLDSMRLMAVTDEDVIVAYVRAKVRHADAGALLQDSTLVLKGTRGRDAVVNPLERVERNASAEMMRLGDRLGLSPAARASLTVESQSGPLAAAERLLS